MNAMLPSTTTPTLYEQAIMHSPLPLLSTYWVPLDEFLTQWATFGQTLPDFPFALLSVGHAFFALAHECRAHSHYTQVAQTGAQLAQAAFWRRYEFTWKQAERDLHESCYHWSRAVFHLDHLLTRLLTDELCTLVRQHSRAARWQQERLWALLDEVRGQIATWRGQPLPHEEGASTP